MLLTKNNSLASQAFNLALFLGLLLPAADAVSADQTTEQADQPRSKPLKTTPDPIPDGVLGFNGMLVGRLASKDVEKGTFVVQVDVVSRVWRNSKAENPKSMVGKSVEIAGVFGRFLDVLVVTRKGETLEFECKHDGERLVFPGELLRKVADFDPADYPGLPEAFRGFRGAMTATIQKKDEETFELIIKADKITSTGEGSTAKEPKSIEGKPLMLAGFWNRKEQYHRLKVGDKIEVAMRHIGMRSEHLTVTEIVRKSKDPAAGFRGIVVGRLVKKDVERGTLTLNVDAVPRVWRNNKSPNPKALRGTNLTVGGATGAMLDALVVTKVGETLEVGALSDGEKLRVGEVLRKVPPVKPGDYPELPDSFRRFRGFVIAKVIRKDAYLMELIVEIKQIKQTLSGNHAEKPESILGKQAMLGGFWNRKETFHDIKVGDTIACGVHHRLVASDLLNVIESVEKIKQAR